MDIQRLIQETLDPRKLVNTAIARKYEIMRSVCKGALFNPEFEKLLLQYMEENRSSEFEDVQQLNKLAELTRSTFGLE